MPKIIENLEAKLIQEAQKQITESGYGAMTIRSVAKGCGVGIGTFYNYFSSKEQLFIAIFTKKWEHCLNEIRAFSDTSDSPLPVLQYIYDLIRQYDHSYRDLFADAATVSDLASSFNQSRAILRSQLAQSVRRFLTSDFEAEFIIEALVVWTAEGRSFDEIYTMIGRLI